MPPSLENVWSTGTLSDWLRENVDSSLVLSDDGVTIAMLIARLDDIADREWNDRIDAMGEDA